jgi:Putative peptidoglycan binding domain
MFAIAPVFIGNSPANAQIVVDGSLREYRPSTAPTLNYGARGPVVRDLQAFLRNRGYYFGRIDGIYGYRTDRAVRNFQYSMQTFSELMVLLEEILGEFWRIVANMVLGCLIN